MSEFVFGTSVTGINPRADFALIDALEQSDIETFELTAVLWSDDYDRTLRRAFRDMLERAGKRAWSYHIPFSAYDDLSSPDEEIRLLALRRFRVLFDDAVWFGCRCMVIHPSSEPIDQAKRGEHIAQLRRSLMELNPLLARHDMMLAVELLPRLCLGNSADELLAILDGLDERFGVCLDVNHGMSRYRELPADIRKIGSRLMTLHISDYDGVDEKHWMPGEGVIDWPAVVAALREVGYCAPFNYEIKLYEGSHADRVAGMTANFKWIQSL